ncbi:hypothetical protein [Cerasicoccus frondis]|uniref:hypothetical protein n=1 Tax=Cerasicoccus frondis TaxID=490090 RepID=UPI002852A477|nr:hypothetical protein [Cerasicoccus frondis]
MHWAWLCILLISLPAVVRADGTITETYDLTAGWNTVYPSVAPTEPKVADAFADLPDGSRVYAYFPAENPGRFVDSGSDAVWNGPSWQRWSNTSPESELNDLYAVVAQIPMVIYVPEDATLSIEGAPVATIADTGIYQFDLRGLIVDEDNSVTFNEFFSATNPPTAVFDLVDGRWQEVSLDTVVERGRAYWFYHEDATSYDGPLRFRNLPSGSLYFGVGFTTIDYSTRLDSTSLVIELVSGSIDLEIGDGFLADEFSALLDEITLSEISASLVSRLQLRLASASESISGEAVICLKDSLGYSARYLTINF